jgi:predicted dehydrogenase
MKRRDVLKAGAVGAGLVVLRSGVLMGADAPSNKLNVACIGVGGRGGASVGACKNENVVALCDVNANNLKKAAEQFPQAQVYTDWRKCLDQKGMDAVTCATTDHTHAFINIWAMNRGMSVYSEKPLANSVEEAHLVRQTYLKNKDKLATQHGTQIHATDNYRRMVELIRGGAIGTPQEVRVWCSRTPAGGDYLEGGQAVPDWMDWDLWIGPSPMHPFNSGYLGGCLAWNRFWDFGSGQIGDMGSHMMDMACWGLDLGLSTTCKAEGSEPRSDATCPTWLTAEWDHPANDWRPAVKVYWYDGGKKPGLPTKVFDRDELFKGALFKGDQGFLLCDYDFRILMPTKGDMTHYKSPKKEDLIPASKGHHEEWILAAKGDKKTTCNFDYAGALVENNLLALVAYRVGKPLEWDSAALKAKNCPEADAFIKKTYRDGWTLNG